MPINIIMVVEDLLSEAVAGKLLAKATLRYHAIRVTRLSKSEIQTKIDKFNRAARSHAFFVLTDQDTEKRCPPAAIKSLRAPLHRNLLYRFAVMETESWLLADRAGMAKFLSVPANKIPQNPETIPNPKEFLISLARKSKSSQIRKEIVPRANSTSKNGPYYNPTMSQFVQDVWDINAAAKSSQSLRRTFARLQSFTPSTNIPAEKPIP